MAKKAIAKKKPAIKVASKAVVRKRRNKNIRKQISRYSGFVGIAMTLLGGLSMIPYELGKSSLIITPDLKENLTLIGLVSGALLTSLRQVLNIT